MQTKDSIKIVERETSQMGIQRVMLLIILLLKMIKTTMEEKPRPIYMASQVQTLKANIKI